LFGFTIIHISGRATEIAPGAQLQSLTSVHYDDCLGAKVPVIAVSTAYKPVVNAMRRKITTFGKIVSHQRQFDSAKAQLPLV
jgi:hypothetical protein